MKTKKGESGIGTLILLIALVLVAAVAASVLLQTSSTLQSRALATGSKSQVQVSTQITISRIWAENGTQGSLGYIYADVRLGAGSEPVNLQSTLLDFFQVDASISAIYNGTYPTCTESIIDSMALASPNLYAVQYLAVGDQHMDGYLQVAELARLCFAAPRPLAEKEGFRLSIFPKSGMLTQARARAPDTITEERYTLFPI